MTALGIRESRAMHSMGIPWDTARALGDAGMTAVEAKWLDKVFARRRGRKRAAKRERTRERQRARLEAGR